jgi:branched-chain amino acid transport system ATP-binding protein
MEVMKVRNVAKHFGGLTVLQDVSFDLGAGEKAALIGPNGAGKTTFLNILSGLLRPTSGSISFLGYDLAKLTPNGRVALGLSRSFQVSSLFPGLSVFENMLMALFGLQRSRYQMVRSFLSYRENNARAQELLEGADLWIAKDAPVSELSHGEKRRLEIALSLSSRPKVLLLDEPNAGLDGAETSSLIRIIEELPPDTTTLVVAHDVDFIYRLCNRVLVLYYGSIIADGSCQEIQADQRVRSIYLGRRIADARVE